MTATTDPLVALVYGAMTYPSLRPGVTTTADLVAGQPGPWTLSDPDLAEQAHDIVNRLRTPVPADGTDELLAVLAADPLGCLIDACRTARRALGAPELVLPKVLEHQALALDERLEAFITSTTTITAPPTTPPTTDDTAATGDDDEVKAIEWGSDLWMATIRGAGLSIPDALAALRSDDKANGRAPTPRLREVTGHPARTLFLLNWIADSRTTP